MPKRKYSRKHRGGGGQCSSLGCKDNEIPDFDKIVMANDFLNNNLRNKNKTEYTDIYNKVLANIRKKFPEGIDGYTILVEAFNQPKNQKKKVLFEGNCNMFRDNLIVRLKTGYMEELKEKDKVVLSVRERQLITQNSKEIFEKEFNEKKAAEEKRQIEAQEKERQEKERQEKKRQQQNNPFTQNIKTSIITDRATRSNRIENKLNVVLSTARNKSQNSRQPK
jgi:hypothetical protein